MIDLHMHSSCSDGRHSPEDLVEILRSRGVLGAALTDHDTQAGTQAFCEAARLAGLYALPGVEVSSRLRPISGGLKGQDGLPGFSAEGPEVHLLVYGILPGDTLFAQLLAAIRRERVRRFESMLEILAQEGVVLAPESFGPLLETSSAGRPHLAKELVRQGHAGSFAQAFHRYLANDRPAGVPKRLPSAAEVVQIAHAENGVVVLAHPGKSLPEEDYHTALHCDIDGLEAKHPGHKGGQSRVLQELARRNRLFWTAGSDYHGIREDGSDYRPPRFSLHELSDRLTYRLRRGCRP